MEGLCKCSYISAQEKKKKKLSKLHPRYSESSTAAELTRPPVQDLEPGSAVGHEHPVSPRAERETPVSLPTATCHLGAPAVQQPQGVAVGTQVLPHRHPSVS